jgi:hypothetical protein
MLPSGTNIEQIKTPKKNKIIQFSDAYWNNQVFIFNHHLFRLKIFINEVLV